MKTKIFTLLAASCLCLFSACSDDSSESLGDKCGENNGVTEGCVVGTWNLSGLYKKSDNAVKAADYGAAPSVLIIKDDGTFEFTYTSSPASEMAAGGCGGEKNYGKWEIEGNNLKITVNVGTCLTSHTITPTVTETEMNINGVVFQTGDNTDPLTKDDNTEIFQRIAE